MASRLGEICKELRLADLEKLALQVDYRDPHQYLTDVLELALKQRQTRRIERLIRQAGFPSTKTLEGFDFAPVSFPNSIDKEGLLSLGFMDRRENLCFVGSCGTGKTYLATALGLKACGLGKSVMFYRCVDLANELLEKYPKGQAGKLINQIAKCDLLILDEVGFIPFSNRAAEMLFTVISNSYERQSVIITSNLNFGDWNRIFCDDRLTAALIDRLIHHSHILAFEGPSYRFKQALANRGTNTKEVLGTSSTSTHEEQTYDR